jgi:hypothetical protein
MAGTVPGFNPDEVRAGLRLAMTVGLPPVEADQPTFYFPREASTTGSADEDEMPFDITKKRVLEPPRFVRVPCAIEYFDNQGKIENFGLIVPSKVELTLLDQEYAKVKGFEYVVIGGSRFWYSRTATPAGLVSIGVFTIYCTAEDQA